MLDGMSRVLRTRVSEANPGDSREEGVTHWGDVSSPVTKLTWRKKKNQGLGEHFLWVLGGGRALFPLDQPLVTQIPACNCSQSSTLNANNAPKPQSNCSQKGQRKVEFRW